MHRPTFFINIKINEVNITRTPTTFI